MHLSIHALLAECDNTLSAGIPSTSMYFNPRTPYGVRRTSLTFIKCLTLFQSTHSIRSATRYRPVVTILKTFQSTHSIRSATISPVAFPAYPANISIHALHTECDWAREGLIKHQKAISIHALHTECDNFTSRASGARSVFQSTHSIRSATQRRLPQSW